VVKKATRAVAFAGTKDVRRASAKKRNLGGKENGLEKWALSRKKKKKVCGSALRLRSSYWRKKGRFEKRAETGEKKKVFSGIKGTLREKPGGRGSFWRGTVTAWCRSGAKRTGSAESQGKKKRERRGGTGIKKGNSFIKRDNMGEKNI